MTRSVKSSPVDEIEFEDLSLDKPYPSTVSFCKESNDSPVISKLSDNKNLERIRSKCGFSDTENRVSASSARTCRIDDSDVMNGCWRSS